MGLFDGKYRRAIENYFYYCSNNNDYTLANQFFNSLMSGYPAYLLNNKKGTLIFIHTNFIYFIGDVICLFNKIHVESKNQLKILNLINNNNIYQLYLDSNFINVTGNFLNNYGLDYFNKIGGKPFLRNTLKIMIDNNMDMDKYNPILYKSEEFDPE